MRILGIETSCDETAVAVIEVSGLSAKPRFSILSNVVSSQIKLHAKFGGVVPNLAKREHQRNLVPVLLASLREAGIPPKARLALGGMNQESRKRGRVKHDSRFPILDSILEREPELLKQFGKKIIPLEPPAIDAIAVTRGPGLAPALWVGVNFARALSFLWRKPIIPVNHLEGHIYTNLIPNTEIRNQKLTKRVKGSTSPVSYPIVPILLPALTLIVSGGHTELVLMRRYGKYQVLGETLDDAAGEAFDKVAKMMRLGFPGGPIISKLAEAGNAKAILFPRPMLNANSLDFSFSGLKTAVLYKIQELGRIGDRAKRDIAASFEQAVVDVLVSKTIRAAKQYRAKTVMIGGGVAANKKLRAELAKVLKKQFPGATYLMPSASLTGDNALMIALAGYFWRKSKVQWESLRADANLRLDDPH